MFASTFAILFSACASMPSFSSPPLTTAPLEDLQGDPLPPHAVARIGTIRFRHSEQVCALAFSSDGTRLTSVTRHDVSVWEVPSGRPLSHYFFEGQPLYPIVTPVVSPDGTLVAYTLEKGAICVRETISGKVRCTLPDTKPGVVRLIFSRDGRWLAGGDFEGNLVLWDLAVGKTCWQGKGGNKAEAPGWPNLGHSWNSLALSPDGRTLAKRASEDRTELWDIKTEKCLGTVPAPAYRVTSLTFSADGKNFMWLDDYTGEIAFWDLAKKAVTRRLQDVPGGVFRSLTCSPDGKYVASGGADHAVHLWNLATGKEVLGPEPGLGGAVRTRFLADGNTLLSQGNHLNELYLSGIPRLWDLKGRPLRRVTFNYKDVRTYAISPDATMIAVALGSLSEAAVVQLRDLANGKVLAEVKPMRGYIVHLAFSPDGRFLWISSHSFPPRANLRDSSHIQMWKRTSNTALEMVAECNGFEPVVAPNSQWFVDCADPGWEFIHCESGKSYRRYPNHYGEVRAASPSGRILVCTGYGQQGPVRTETETGQIIETRKFEPALLMELATGKPIRKLDGYPACCAISPDGHIIAGTGAGDSIVLWDTCTGKQVGKLEGHRGQIDSLSFSPDGRFLVSGSWDTTSLIWDYRKHRRNGIPAQTKLSAERLEELWQDLHASDPACGYAAVTALVHAPSQTIPFLKKRIREPLTNPRQVQSWIDDLSKNHFPTRMQAATQLTRMGELAAPVLRQALTRPLALESKRRVETLLESIDSPTGEAVPLGTLRALEALELIGTPQACQLMAELSKTYPAEAQRQEAYRSLERLKQRLATVTP